MHRDSVKHVATPRQRPISCRFCRSRKLRCSREAPCSNCISRGLEYDFETAASNNVGSSECELLGRIRRLEKIVCSQNEQLNKRQSTIPTPDSETFSEIAHDPEVVISPQIKVLEEDVAWLESIYKGRADSSQLHQSAIIFKVCPIQQIADADVYVFQQTPNNIAPLSTRCIWLPQYHEAKILLQKYIRDINYVQQVVHVPSLPSIIDEIYTGLQQQGQVKPGHIILALSIFASSCMVWCSEDSSYGLLSSPTEAIRQILPFIKAAEDVIDIVSRTNGVSLEGIQGIVIMIFVIGNMEGVSRRLKHLHNMSLSLARDLELHCIDHSSHAELANSPQAEMGRRLWWYLTACDWAIAARFTWAAQAFYQCHLRHMAVKKPMNIDDEEIKDCMTRLEKPISQPTTMSYSLLKLQLCEISRSLVDRHTTMTAGDTLNQGFNIAMDIDSELQSFLDNLPAYCVMSQENIIEAYGFDHLRAAHVVHQGHMIRSFAYTLRCKIHLPFFTRGYIDPTYASSRDSCRHAAREIVKIEVAVSESGHGREIRLRLLGILIAVFMASIVLLMDLCYHKTSPSYKDRLAEITSAYKILEEARETSPVATKFLDSLMHVLRKHRLAPAKQAVQAPNNNRFSNEASPSTCQQKSISSEYSTLPLGSIALESTEQQDVPFTNYVEQQEMGAREVPNRNTPAAYFTELQQSFEQGFDNVDFDWNNLFPELASSFI